jgi:hypothetical protein
VVDITPPPVEWVKGGGRWWVTRVGVPAIVTATLIGFFLIEWRTDPVWATNNSFYGFGLILCATAVESVFIYSFPSVRRIGISPLCLVVDVGLQKFTYSWTDVKEVTRTRVGRFRWNQVSSVSRTRISVGSGLFRNWFSLSAEQGDRLAQFLRIP